MESIRATLEQAIGLLVELARADVSRLDDESLCQTVGAIEQAGRLVDTLRTRGASEIDARSAYEAGNAGLAQRHGHTRGAHLLEQLTRISPAEAARRARLGAAIRPDVALSGEALPARFPLLADAMIAGTVGTDAARMIITCLSQAAATAAGGSIDAAERALVDTARAEPAEIVAVHARVWREALDPDGAEPRDEAVRRRRAFRLGRERDGVTPFTGVADPTLASLFRTAFVESLAPGATPRFMDETDARAGTTSSVTRDGEIIESVRDPRTPDQRRHDILTGMLTAALRNANAHAETGQIGSLRPTATVMAVITLAELRAGRGVGWIDDHDEPIPAHAVRKLACEGGVTPILLGDNGEVLHLGRTQRLFSPAQRRALAVRDGGCVWPQCSAPPGWCHAHHVTEWENGGRTDIDNGALLCPAHHHMLHASEFTMKMIRGKPRLLAPPWLDPAQLWRPLGRTRATMAATL
ncbi:HNH endonuclease [Homoserinimonas aerilata]|uniref:HNH endonuclease n=1 Tax=Homoserinimonas aerilata TaxID=1162970 RepID=A0A542YI24_9MICO|nr:HNH endonuclease signature motif containing protein [Homoserinimonas aerilata]TQL47661.1 HNH endonuclease [Homoserinimonas aerilata]